jgi:hypothetical protein
MRDRSPRDQVAICGVEDDEAREHGEAIADGYDSCAMTSMPRADLECAAPILHSSTVSARG